MQSGKIRKWAIGVIAVFVALFVQATELFAASVSLRFNVIKNWNSDATSSYAIQMSNPSFFFGPNLQVTAPDGSVTTPLPNPIVNPFGTLFDIDGLTFSELQARFVGSWTIKESSASNATFQFSLLPFTPTTFFSEQPTIVSPHDGDILPPQFNIDWSFPSGVITSGQHVQFTGNFRGTLNGSYPSTNQNRYRFSDTMRDFEGNRVTTPEIVTMKVGSITPMGSYLTPGTLISGTSLNTYVFDSFSYFQNTSAPITVTIVPEPKSVVLLGFGIMGLGVWRRRRVISR